MPGVRALLGRVQRLEEAHKPSNSPFVAFWGSFDAFAAECEAKIVAGKLDKEFREILEILARQHEQGLWNQRPSRRRW
jgi:hypothetical protein